MKQILLLILVACSFFSRVSAQTYSCVTPGQKSYFTNASGYLRGMRIDSSKLIDGNTVYYPFKTARLAYMAWSERADTAGGSWQGREIIETPDKHTFIPNIWGDTVCIKNSALLNESWIFFKDSTAVHYEATVIAQDTITINGITDSVKAIRLTAKNGTSILSTDPLNNLELILSGEHGWLKVPDLYLFPYHAAGASFNSRFDCYFFKVNGGLAQLDPAQLAFRRVEFIPAYNHRMYHYEIGDILQHYKSSTYNTGTSSYKHIRTQVTAKQLTDSSIIYTMAFKSGETIYPGNAAPYSIADSGLTTQEQKKYLLSDTVKMPEEWFCGKYYYYWPEDSSFCYKSAAYGYQTDEIFENGRFGGGGPEPAYPEITYKEGLGDLSWATGGFPLIHNMVGYGSLRAARKGGLDLCDRNNSLEINERSGSGDITLQLFPNPATELICIELPGALPTGGYTLEMYDVSGRKVIKENLISTRTLVHTGAVPNGIYWLRIWGRSGSAGRKVIIRR